MHFFAGLDPAIPPHAPASGVDASIALRVPERTRRLER
jgi:hypothetical protein